MKLSTVFSVAFFFLFSLPNSAIAQVGHPGGEVISTKTNPQATPNIMMVKELLWQKDEKVNKEKDKKKSGQKAATRKNRKALVDAK